MHLTQKSLTRAHRTCGQDGMPHQCRNLRCLVPQRSLGDWLLVFVLLDETKYGNYHEA